MVAMAMKTMMSTVNSGTTVTSGTTVVPPIVPVTVPTTQTAAQTTPCVPTICPEGYRLLNDETASPNCYFYSDNSRKMWSDAQKVCTMTPGAYLWRPNTKNEADAVKTTLGFANSVDIWTGANSPTHDENFVFAVDNGAFSLTSLPFGIRSSITNDDCIEIDLTRSSNMWQWDDDSCKSEFRFICELPRKTCP